MEQTSEAFLMSAIKAGLSQQPPNNILTKDATSWNALESILLNNPSYTPRKTNISPTKGAFQKESSLPTAIFIGDILFFGGLNHLEGVLYVGNIFRSTYQGVTASIPVTMS